MKENNSPSLTPFIITFIIMDLIILGILIAFENIGSLGNGLIASLLGKIWIFLLIASFIALIVSIIAIKDYLNLRTAMAEELMVLIFAFWFGVARVPLMNDNGERHFVLFTFGSILLLVLNIAIQIDLLCAPKIMNFLTTDKKDREVAKRTDAIEKATRLFPAEPPVFQGHETQDKNENARPAEKESMKETTHFSTARTRSQNADSVSARTMRDSALPDNTQTIRPNQKPMTKEQLLQFRELQEKRRAARAAAAQQLQNSSVQFDKLTPPSRRNVQKNLSPTQVESLFFKDE